MSPGFISARQLLLVVASDWTSNGAYLGRYERPGAAAPWVPAGSPLAVSLGRGGLAWGRAFLIPGISPGPIKREGDGCSPAGAFPITALFGVSAPAAGAKLPWLQATPDLKCVDDPDSWHYNRIVDQNSVDRIDWQSCEDMLRTDGRYEVGAVVGCNDDPVEPGAGSCLFLHVCSFYPLSHGPSTRHRGITRPDFRPCSACPPRSQAPLLPLRAPADCHPA